MGHSRASRASDARTAPRPQSAEGSGIGKGWLPDRSPPRRPGRASWRARRPTTSAGRRRRLQDGHHRRVLGWPRWLRLRRRDGEKKAPPATPTCTTLPATGSGTGWRPKLANGCRQKPRLARDGTRRGRPRSEDEPKPPAYDRLLPGFFFAGQVPPSTRKYCCPASGVLAGPPAAPDFARPPKKMPLPAPDTPATARPPPLRLVPACCVTARPGSSRSSRPPPLQVPRTHRVDTTLGYQSVPTRLELL